MTSVTAEQPTTEQPAGGAQPAAVGDAPSRRTFGGFLGQLVRDSGYLLLSLPMGILTFTVAVAGWSTAIGSLLTFIGVPVAVLTIAAMRGLSRVERRRAAVVLREPVPEHYSVRLPFRREDWSSLHTIWSWFKGLFQDRQMYRDLVYGLLLLPIGIVSFTVLTVAVTMTLGFITFPTWWWALPDGWDTGLWHIDTWTDAGILAGAGLVLLPIAALLVRGTSAASAGIACGLLTPTRRELERRVEHLQETRAGAVDAARRELERIERDLHDGAQARLVAVAMEPRHAPSRSCRPVTRAARRRWSARRARTRSAALAELRDLARGIRPPLLSDRGLARGGHLARRARRRPDHGRAATCRAAVPARVETAAYFVAGEALANVAKHAEAQSASRPRRAARAAARGRGRRRRPRRRRPRPAAGSPACASASRRSTGRSSGHSPAGGPTTIRGGASVRVVIAEDLALLRDGLTRLLRDNGCEVVAAVAGRATRSSHAVERERPDVCDRRRPAAADVQRRGHARARSSCARAARRTTASWSSPSTSSSAYATELLADGRGGVGYLLKDRVVDVGDFVDAVRRVAGGRHGARPGGRRAARSPGAAPRAAGRADPARARGARADGRGPLEQRHRRASSSSPTARSRSTSRASSPSSACRRPTRRPPARARRDRVAGGVDGWSG